MQIIFSGGPKKEAIFGTSVIDNFKGVGDRLSVSFYHLFPPIMKKNSFLLLALAAAGTLTGCGDDKKSEAPKPKTKAELLAAHDWILSEATVTVGGQTGDAFEAGLYEECDRDDYYRFTNTNNGGTYTLNDNTNVCSPPNAETGAWSLNADQSKLTLTPQGDDAEELTVTELTDSSLKLSATGDIFGNAVTFKLSYKVK